MSSFARPEHPVPFFDYGRHPPYNLFDVQRKSGFLVLPKIGPRCVSVSVLVGQEYLWIIPVSHCSVTVTTVGTKLLPGTQVMGLCVGVGMTTIYHPLYCCVNEEECGMFVLPPPRPPAHTCLHY